MTTDMNTLLECVIEIARTAGSEVLEIYNSEEALTVQTKGDGSPVTNADLASHEVIVSGLKKISEYPILSEEDPVEYNVRKEWDTFWLVDPLDGTKDFIKRTGQFTINIALVKGNKPVLGVVYVPVENQMYSAAEGKGAFQNGERIQNTSERTDLIGADSNFHSTEATQNFFQKHNITNIKGLGSSLKMCKVASGEVDVYPRLNGTMEWDTAAAHCIAHEAGCKLVDVETKQELVYNKENLLNNHFIASRNNLSFLD